MDWIRLKIAEALGGKQPINKKLVLGVGAFVAAAVFLLNAVNTGPQVKVAVSAESTAAPLVVKAATIYVHVVGEVIAPGIYELDSGSRIVDLIFAAGGFGENADQSSVNLAREVADGEQVVVFKVGDVTNSIQGSARPGLPIGEPQISLNRGTQAELEQLPGVGPALAGRMIDWRTANGGFKKKEDLLNISGIGEKLFSAIKNEVTL